MDINYRGLLAQVCIIFSFFLTSNAQAFTSHTGEEIFSVKFSPDFGNGDALGYVCQHIGILGADIYTWNCKLMVVNIKEGTVEDLYYHEKLRYEREYPITSITRSFWNEFGLWIMLCGGFLYLLRRRYPKKIAIFKLRLIHFYRNISKSFVVISWKKSSGFFKVLTIFVVFVGVTICMSLINYKTPYDRDIKAQLSHDPSIYGDARFRTGRVSSNDVDITPDRHDELERHLAKAQETFTWENMPNKDIQANLRELRIRDCQEVAKAATYYAEPRPEINAYLKKYCYPTNLIPPES